MSKEDDDFLKEIKVEFLEEALYAMQDCEEAYLSLESNSSPGDDLSRIFRVAHSIKGGGAAVGFEDLSEFAHKVEDLLAVLRVYPQFINQEVISLLLSTGDEMKHRLIQLRDRGGGPWDVSDLLKRVIVMTDQLQQEIDETPEGSIDVTRENCSEVDKEEVHIKDGGPSGLGGPGSSSGGSGNESKSVKVGTERIDSVLNIVGELVVLKSQLLQDEVIAASGSTRLTSVVSQMDKLIRELHDRALGMRLTSLRAVMLKVQRIVRDISITLNKPVEVVISGEETEVDRTLIELLNDPLVHIVRNAIDHGIESTSDRLAAGKPERARISIQAEQKGERVVVTVQDDGAGVNKEKVVKAAIEKGLLPSESCANNMPDSEIYDLLFTPGFSTAAVVSDISGRGVGLDVAKSNLQKVRGNIEVSSTIGQGTCFKISVPLTAAITDGMVLSVDGEKFVVPVHTIHELVRKDQVKIAESGSGYSVVNYRDQFMMTFSLRDFYNLGSGSPKTKGGTIAFVENGGRVVGIEIDEVLFQSQFVVKPLGEMFSSVTGLSGAAVLGDGRVALVLDIDSLINKFSKDTHGYLESERAAG